MKHYPLINLTKSKQPPFWVYNNYAYVYDSYLESLKKDPQYYAKGDYQDKPKLDESLQIKLSNNKNLKGIFIIENESFEWVEQVYYQHLADLEFLFVHNWNNSDYTINCFSANYEIYIPEYTASSPNEYGTEENPIPYNEIYKIDVYDFESAGLYPNSERLNLLAKEYLRKIISTNLENFLNFHFKSCYHAFKFLVHVIEVTDDIWSYAVNDIECKKVFKKWIKDKIKFLEISNPQVLIDIYTNQKKIDYDNQYFEEDLHGNLHLDIYGEPVSLSVPFEVFYNAKLEVKIYEFFQLNEIPTPKPPQVQNDLEEIKNKIKVLCDPATFGHIILELYEKQYIELPQTQGDINFSKTAIQLLQLFDINTTKDYLAKCVNPNSNSLSEFTKRQIEIPLYDKKKPS